MTEALVASNVALWTLVLVLAGIVLALMRQIGVLHERISPAGALVGREGPRVGERAPPVQVEDWRGERLDVGAEDPDGRSTLVFFLSPSCPVCKTLLPVLESVRRSEGGNLRVVLASDGERSEHAEFVREQRLEREIYVISAELGIAYQVGRLPYAVLIDADGVIRARGLVNTREHLESLFEAREREVGSVQEYRARHADSARVA